MNTCTQVRQLETNPIECTYLCILLEFKCLKELEDGALLRNQQLGRRRLFPPGLIGVAAHLDLSAVLTLTVWTTIEG